MAFKQFSPSSYAVLACLPACAASNSAPGLSFSQKKPKKNPDMQRVQELAARCNMDDGFG